MNRIVAGLMIVCLITLCNSRLQADSLATSYVYAGNAEAPVGNDSADGPVSALAATSDTDPQFGTAMANASVVGPSLSVFDFAASFEGPAWVASSETTWVDVLRFRFPTASATVPPTELQVEVVGSFTWNIESNGRWGVGLQNKFANYNTFDGLQQDDFGNIAAAFSGSATLSATVPFDSVIVDPLDETMYLAEVSLGMSLQGLASSGDHTHGSWPTATADIDFDLTDIIVHGIGDEAPEIESDSGEGYDFTSELTADFDDDGDVDGRDFLLWQRGFSITMGAELMDGDSNADGIVDGIDLSVWQDQYAESGHLVGLAVVPEPMSATLIGSIVLIGISTRRKRLG